MPEPLLTRPLQEYDVFITCSLTVSDQFIVQAALRVRSIDWASDEETGQPGGASMDSPPLPAPPPAKETSAADDVGRRRSRVRRKSSPERS